MFRKSIEWKYNPTVIKNSIINHLTYLALSEEQHPVQLIKNWHKKALASHLDRINQTQLQTPISLDKECWQEIEEQVIQKYRSMTKLQVPWKAYLGVIMLVMCVLLQKSESSSLAELNLLFEFAPMLIGGFGFYLILKTLTEDYIYGKDKAFDYRPLNKKTERRLLKEAIDKNYDIGISYKLLKNKAFIDQINQDEKKVIFKAILQEKISINFKAAALQKKISMKMGKSILSLLVLILLQLLNNQRLLHHLAWKQQVVQAATVI